MRNKESGSGTSVFMFIVAVLFLVSLLVDAFVSKNDGNLIWSIVFLILSVVCTFFFVLASFPLLRKLRGDKMRKRFRPVYAKIDRVDLHKGYTADGRNPYRVYLSYLNTEDGQLYKFESENIRNDPTNDIAAAGLTELPVHVDLSKPTRYFVDTDVIYSNVVDLT